MMIKYEASISIVKVRVDLRSPPKNLQHYHIYYCNAHRVVAGTIEETNLEELKGLHIIP